MQNNNIDAIKNPENMDMLDVLKERKIWVLWRYMQVDGKITKIPYSPNNRKAKSNDPDTWSKYKEVQKVSSSFDGIGYMFDGSIVGIDLDKVLNNGRITDELSKQLVDKFNSYVEISPSGTGLHCIGLSDKEFKLEKKKHRVKNTDYAYEVYNSGRFFTYTGNVFKNKFEIKTFSQIELEEVLKILGYPWQEKVIENRAVPNNQIDKSSEEILDRMLKSPKYKKLFECDDSEYNNDTSSADMAFMSGIKFYSHANPQQMEEIFLMSRRANRDKVSKRLDYLPRLIRDALAYPTSDFYDWSGRGKTSEEFDTTEYLTDKKGPILNTENVKRLLRQKMQIKYDEFKQQAEWFDNGVWKNLSSGDDVKIQNLVACAHSAFRKVSKEMTMDAVIALARENSYDSAKDYFEKLKWDGENRIDTWLSKTYGVDDCPVYRKIGSNWLKGLANRVAHPGCKFDYVLVIEGSQGIKKSMSFATLGKDWHIETITTPKDKDFFMGMQGNLIVEFSEGETLTRGEMKEIKAIITRQIDDVRLPYDRFVSHLPRRSVFAMTTNEDQYLKDTTGNRRWLPVRVPDGFVVNIEWLKDNREQLLAEAYHRAVVLKETTWEFPQEIVEMQEERVIVDPIEEKIMEIFETFSNYEIMNGAVTTSILYKKVYDPTETDKYIKPMSKVDEMVFASVMKNKLHMKRIKKQVDGERKARWYPTNKTPMPEGSEAELAVI